MNPLFVRLGFQNQEFINGVNAAMKSLKQIEDSTALVAKGMQTLKTVSATLIGVWTFSRVIGEMKGLVTESTMLAARYTTLGIVMTQVGRNVGVGADQMEQYSKALQKTGISMIESRQNITSMARANMDLTKSTELARIAQDAAVIGQMNSSEAFSNLVYGIQSANIRVLRTIGINVNFEASYRKLAQSINKTVEELTENDRAQARVNAVVEAGKSIFGVYAAAMETAAKQMASLVRYVQDFKVMFGEAFEPALIVLVKGVTEAIKNLQQVVQDPAFKDNLGELVRIFSRWAGALFEVTGRLVEFPLAVVNAQKASKLAKLGFLDEVAFSQLEGFSARQKMVGEAAKKAGSPTSEMLDLMMERKGIEDQLQKISAWRGLPLGSEVSLAQFEEGPKQKLVAIDAQLKILKQTQAEVADAALMKQTDKDYADFLGKKAKAESDAQKAKEAAQLKQKAEADALQKHLKKLQDDKVNDAVRASGEEIEAWDAFSTFTYKDANELALKMSALREKEKEDEIKVAKDREDAYRDMYRDMQDIGIEGYEFEAKLLLKRKEDYIKLTNDEVLAEKWFSNEYEKLLIQQAKKSDDFIKGVQAGFAQLERDQYTWGQAGFDIVQGFASNSKAAMSDFFFDAMKGELKSFSDYWNAFWNSMLRVFSDIVARMVADWMMAQAKMAFAQSASSGGLLAMFGIGGGGDAATSVERGVMLGGDTAAMDLWAAQVGVMHSGGIVGHDVMPKVLIPDIAWAGMPRAHMGLKIDEVPIIAQRGERILSRSEARRYEEQGNVQGKQPSTFIIHMDNPVFQDLETQKQVFAQIAEIVARRVAPDAVVQSYDNDGSVRRMIRGKK